MKHLQNSPRNKSLHTLQSYKIRIRHLYLVSKEPLLLSSFAHFYCSALLQYLHYSSFETCHRLAHEPDFLRRTLLHSGHIRPNLAIANPSGTILASHPIFINLFLVSQKIHFLVQSWLFSSPKTKQPKTFQKEQKHTSHF